MDLILHNIAGAASALVPILYALLVTVALDVLTGLYAAWRSGTLDGAYIDTFVKTHILDKVTPILITLLAGVAIGGTDNVAGTGLIAAGAAAALAYEGVTIASILGNVGAASNRTKGLPKGIVPPTL